MEIMALIYFGWPSLYSVRQWWWGRQGFPFRDFSGFALLAANVIRDLL